MRTLRLLIAYDGTRFQGWQRQENGPTIQAAIEDALAPLLGRSSGDPRRAPVVHGAGRTDAGVHALGQVASVDGETRLPADAIQRALNAQLDRDIRVLHVTDEAPGFNARFSATGKTYRYRLVTTLVVSPFAHRFVWHRPEPLDVPSMRQAAADIVGRHDFSAFKSSGSAVLDSVRTVDRLDIVETGDELVFEIHADGFLRHMVRAIVGTVVEVGTGRRAPLSMPTLLESLDRRQAGETAPAQGLALVSVDYPEAGH